MNTTSLVTPDVTAPVSRQGFTLIEMMISLAAGMAIVLVAVAGFNAAAKSLTATKRLGLEMDLLGQGVLSAFDELDNWQGFLHDQDPNWADLTPIRLPAVPSTGSTTGYRPWLGTPFTAFKSQKTGVPWPPASTGGTPYVRGWIEDEIRWAITADNERTWYTENPAETDVTKRRFGNYAIFGAGGLQTGTSLLNSVTLPPYGDIIIPSSSSKLSDIDHWGWYFDQIEMLGHALGGYGMFDYLPANAFAYVAWKTTNVNWGSVDTSPLGTAGTNRIYREMRSYCDNFNFNGDNESSNPYLMYHSAISDRPGQCLDSLNVGNIFSLTPMSINALSVDQGLPLNKDDIILYSHLINVAGSTEGGIYAGGNANRDSFVDLRKIGSTIRAFGRHWSNNLLDRNVTPDTQAMARFQQRTNTAQHLLPVRPRDWPSAEIRVGRYISLCRFRNQCRVSWFDPITSDHFDLRFSAMGTTLRGARRQRSLDQ